MTTPAPTPSMDNTELLRAITHIAIEREAKNVSPEFIEDIADLIQKDRQQLLDRVKDIVTEQTDRSDKQWRENGQFAFGMQEAGNRIRDAIGQLNGGKK